MRDCYSLRRTLFLQYEEKNILVVSAGKVA